MVTQRTMKKFRALSPEYQKIITDQIEFLSKKQKSGKGRGWFGASLFRWMSNSKQDFEMSDDQIDEFISAVRRERHALGH